MPELVAFCHQAGDRDLEPQSGARSTGVARAFVKLVRSMWASSSSVSPQPLVDALTRVDRRWGARRQQDAQEALSALLEALQADCNRTSHKPVYKELSGEGPEAAQEAWEYARTWHDSIVSDVFEGQLLSTIVCGTCKTASHCFDSFLDLPVELPRGQSLDLVECLSTFTRCEKLEGRNSYHCSCCKSAQAATKKLSINRLPTVLALSLKRYATTTGNRSFSKNAIPVRFGRELDMRPFLSQATADGIDSAKYRLVAVAEHSGSTLSGGHYTATACSAKDGASWSHFNDSLVTPLPSGPSTTATASSAYMLFFRRAELPSALPPAALVTKR